MSWTLGQVKSRVRSLLDDPQGSYVTDSFVVPLINEVYDDCNSRLASTLSSWDISTVECPNITPGTPNLSQLQNGVGPLSTLTDKPERIDWKPAGVDPSYYDLVPNYGVLPDLQPQQSIPGWEWRSEVIWLAASTIAVDLRVRGEFAPAPLVNDSSVLSSAPRIGYVVAYGTSALIATVRGNATWIKEYGEEFDQSMDEILEQLTRESQNETRRVGRMTGNGRRNNSYPIS